MAEDKHYWITPIKWTIARMRRFREAWKTLEIHDRHFLLRWLRDEYPREFWFIANEFREQQRFPQSTQEVLNGKQ